MLSAAGWMIYQQPAGESPPVGGLDRLKFTQVIPAGAGPVAPFKGVSAAKAITQSPRKGSCEQIVDLPALRLLGLRRRQRLEQALVLGIGDGVGHEVFPQVITT